MWVEKFDRIRHSDYGVDFPLLQHGGIQVAAKGTTPSLQISVPEIIGQVYGWK